MILRLCFPREAARIIAELDPFIEEAVRLMGIKVEGKELTGCAGNFPGEGGDCPPGKSTAKGIGPIEMEIAATATNMCPGLST